LIRIFVTGIGVVSAIGDSAASCRESFRDARCGIAPLRSLASRYAGILPCGEVKRTTPEWQELLDAREPGITRTSLLALHAFTQCTADSGLGPVALQSSGMALVGATTVGGMCLTDELYQDAHAQAKGSAYLTSYDCGSVSIYLAQRFGLIGLVHTINTACSSSANAILFGARLMRLGLARRAIVGGADSLAKFTINGFQSLHILSPESCAPFDRDRRGLTLGEGAAFLALEKESDLDGKRVYAELTGYGNSNDAFHPSSLSEEGEGPYLAMQSALAMAGLEPQDIGFINAHGTGTENNDLAESRAMIRLFGHPPPFASTKSFTGHTLGAAGSLEAAFSVLNLSEDELHPNLQFHHPIESTGLQPVLHLTPARIRHVMSNSFGFGGNCTSLVFSQP
jgi:3-oxoacyl-(acyl-carrier-protein) synthase